MDDSYHTISAPTSGIYREKGSRFLSFAYPVNDEKMALDHIARLKKEYHDARHHCFAYVLGKDRQSRAYDAGEPNHTAGDPILNQIRSGELSDILVVVVRYFGGTKLGKSGLINAYKKAAEDALSHAEPVLKVHYSKLELRFSYSTLNGIMRKIDQHNLQLVDQEYGEGVRLVIRLRDSEIDEVMNDFSDFPENILMNRLPG